MANTKYNIDLTDEDKRLIAKLKAEMKKKLGPVTTAGVIRAAIREMGAK